MKLLLAIAVVAFVVLILALAVSTIVLLFRRRKGLVHAEDAALWRPSLRPELDAILADAYGDALLKAPARDRSG
jgi:hypothetical protein